MRLLVTGGCGFIGSNFIHMILAAEPDLIVCNMDKLTYAGNPANVADISLQHPERYFFEKASIANPEAVRRILKEYRINAVINFAAESHVDRSIVDPTPFIHSNVQGLVCLLGAAMEAGVPRFVHVSTDEVYGSLALDDTGNAFTEETPLAANSPYSASKASADLFCRSWHHTYGYPVVVTRCSNNYGPYQFPEKLIPLMYRRAMRDEPLPIYGDGRNVRDWIHVEDHCRGVFLALTKGKPGAVYNLGGAAERNNLEVVQGILDYCGKPESLIRFIKDRPGHDRRYAMNFSLAGRELGFAPSRTFETGLRDTLAWYAANRSWVDGVTSGAYLTFMQNWYGERV